MKKVLSIVFFLAIFAANAAISAVKVTNLYQAEVTIPSQTEDFKEQAVREGLLQVLIKLSGDPDIEHIPLIKETLKRADYYVQEYNYSLPNTDSSQYTLQIHYNTADLNRLLKKAGIPYWQADRPVILVWLVLTHNQHTEVVGVDSRANTAQIIKEASKKYGLPFIFPMLDMIELNQISPQDIISVAMPVLKQASKRYSPDGLLIGQLELKDDGHVESKWHLAMHDNQWDWAIRDKTEDDVISSMLSEVTQILANRDVKKPEIEDYWVQVEISGINQQNDLARLSRYLKELSPVQKVELDQVSGNVVEFSLLVRGSLAAFQASIAETRRLVLKAEDLNDKKFIYEWVR